jgi:hypothetical protein
MTGGGGGREGATQGIGDTQPGLIVLRAGGIDSRQRLSLSHVDPGVSCGRDKGASQSTWGRRCFRDMHLHVRHLHAVYLLDRSDVNQVIAFTAVPCDVTIVNGTCEYLMVWRVCQSNRAGA